MYCIRFNQCTQESNSVVMHKAEMVQIIVFFVELATDVHCRDLLQCLVVPSLYSVDSDLNFPKELHTAVLVPSPANPCTIVALIPSLPCRFDANCETYAFCKRDFFKSKSIPHLSLTGWNFITETLILNHCSILGGTFLCVITVCVQNWVLS